MESGGFRRERRKKAEKGKGNIYLVPKQKNGEELCGCDLLLCTLWVSLTLRGSSIFVTQIDSDTNQGKTLWVRAVCKQATTITLVFQAISNHIWHCLFLYLPLKCNKFMNFHPRKV